MIFYALRRLGQSVITLFLVTIVIFVLLRAVPFNNRQSVLPSSATPVQIAHFNGESAFAQYFRILGQWIRGDFGYSSRLNMSVSTMLAQGLVTTGTLIFFVLILTAIVAIPLGLLQGVRNGTVFDHVATMVVYVVYTVPMYLSGPILVLIFAIGLGWFPPIAPDEPGLGPIFLGFAGMILPIVTLALPSIARVARQVRSGVLGQVDADYVRTAKAKGASRTRILWQHMFRNSLIPVITLLGALLPILISGAMIVEAIFDLPGLGYDLWQASKYYDFPIEIAIVLVSAVATITMSFIVDLVLAAVDPRILR